MRVLVGLPLLLILLAAAAAGALHTSRLAKERLSWQKTTGVVTGHGFAEMIGFGGNSSVEVSFVEYLDFKAPADGSHVFGTGGTVKEAGLAVGDRVTVYYDPADPRESTLESAWTQIIQTIGLAVVFVAGLIGGLLMLGWRPWLAPRSEDPPG